MPCAYFVSLAASATHATSRTKRIHSPVKTVVIASSSQAAKEEHWSEGAKGQGNYLKFLQNDSAIFTRPDSVPGTSNPSYLSFHMLTTCSVHIRRDGEVPFEGRQECPQVGSGGLREAPSVHP